MGHPVDYDRIADVYETRYARNDYTGIQQALAAFVLNAPGEAQRVLEVGCGTAHWTGALHHAGVDVVGVDPAEGMLRVGRTKLPDVRLIRARAEALPCRAATFDRAFCVNALHHFTEPAVFFHEARRVLRDGGGLLTVGLDPHTGRDEWWVYDYFPTALIEDRRRYLPTVRIREMMEASGFSRCETREVQHIPAQITASEAERRGFLHRTSTSQLMVISQAEYDAGLMRIHHANAERRGATVLRTDLRVYGTIGWAV